AAVGAGGLVAMAASPSEWRGGIVWGLGAGLLLQAPLGWWTLKAIGTEQFFLVWGLGMLARFGVLAVAAFALMGTPDRLASPMLVTMVSVLVGLLLVEGVVAMGEYSRKGER
ncbi:MAG TPA: hypothetical protein VM365_13050, partial [Gemmatimonadales bacterium]|nr:hypothetical protein [Gemmatimonadales bacterium]